MHITSLPSPYGVGTLGKEAYDFVDFLKDSNQSIWQILPVNPTGFGDSPYASMSTFAASPYLIDLDFLEKDGLLKKEEYADIDWGDDETQVDYGKLYNNRFDVLKKAADRFLQNPDPEYQDFLEENNRWLDNYALYMALKKANDGKLWLDWPEEYRKYDKEKAKEWASENREEVAFQKVMQYFFMKQWKQLKDYANENGITIIGDLPIYVSLDSADAWAHPELFALNEDGSPAMVAGCPPDGFSADGQLWGNPLYDWAANKATGYDWWVHRMAHQYKLYDIVRIDHFRGFDSFYAIPADAKTAREGQWLLGPGIDLFNVLNQRLDNPPIIAEDLGFLTDSVKKLLKDTGYPGMKILQFAFDSRDAGESEYLPYNYPKNSIAYAGTHDNDTIMGWLRNADPKDVELAKDYMNIKEMFGANWDVIKTLMASPADVSIIQTQDLLGLGSESRMNTPGVLGPNWKWRMKKGALEKGLGEYLGYLTKIYGRVPKKVTEEEVYEESI